MEQANGVGRKDGESYFFGIVSVRPNKLHFITIIRYLRAPIRAILERIGHGVRAILYKKRTSIPTVAKVIRHHQLVVAKRRILLRLALCEAVIVVIRVVEREFGLGAKDRVAKGIPRVVIRHIV